LFRNKRSVKGSGANNSDDLEIGEEHSGFAKQDGAQEIYLDDLQGRDDSSDAGQRGNGILERSPQYWAYSPARLATPSREADGQTVDSSDNTIGTGRKTARSRQDAADASPTASRTRQRPPDGTTTIVEGNSTRRPTLMERLRGPHQQVHHGPKITRHVGFNLERSNPGYDADVSKADSDIEATPRRKKR
jgi:hypothetical protein